MGKNNKNTHCRIKADDCNKDDHSDQTPHLWIFWNDHDLAYSLRALHFVNVARGDLVVVDGRADQHYVRDVARSRGIESDRIYVSQPSSLDFSTQVIQHEMHRVGAWVRSHTSRVILLPASACSASFVEFQVRLRQCSPPDLRIGVEGEDMVWAKLFGYKSIVHPRLCDGDGATSLWQRMLERGSGELQVPRGFICRGVDEVREAWRRLGATAVLKEIDSSGGVGVHFLDASTDLRALEIGTAEIIVEEDLRPLHRQLRFLTIHYDGTTLGPVMEQQFMRDADGEAGALYSGSRTISQDSDVVRSIRRSMQLVVDQLQPTHLGGFDVAVGDDSKLYVLDVNSCRFNGSHGAMAVMRWRYPEYAHFSFFKVVMSEPMRFDRLRERIQDLPWCEAICYDGRAARWVVAGETVAQCEEREEILRRRLR